VGLQNRRLGVRFPLPLPVPHDDRQDQARGCRRAPRRRHLGLLLARRERAAAARSRRRCRHRGGRGRGVDERAWPSVRRICRRGDRRSEKGGLAHAQGDDADDRGGVRLRGGDGGGSMGERQDLGMGSVRADSRLEKDVNKRWYVVHAYSGFEKSVQRALEDRIHRAGMTDKFGKILVPVEEVVDMVRVQDGPYTDFQGTDEDVNYEKSRLRVAVTMFGRSTPVELEYGQVEKA